MASAQVPETDHLGPVGSQSRHRAGGSGSVVGLHHGQLPMTGFQSGRPYQEGCNASLLISHLALAAECQSVDPE